MIRIINTGGTICGVRDGQNKATIAGKTARDLERFLQNKELEYETAMQILSEDMTPAHWIELAELIAKRSRSSDGIVLTHGTFTMGFTSAALSFMLKDLSVPVVLTGAQLPIEELEHHARTNLLHSIRLAGSDMAEVSVLFAGEPESRYSYFHKGTRVRKSFTWRLDPFRSIGEKPLGKITQDKMEFFTKEYKRKDPERKTRADTRLDERVTVLKIYPGFDPEKIVQASETSKGIIIEGYADGSAPTLKRSVLPAIKKASENGVPVFVASQPQGRVTLTEYKSGIDMLKAGATPLGDMLWETALVKLMWVLGHEKEPDRIKNAMLTNISGEITPQSWTDMDKWGDNLPAEHPATESI